MSWLEVARSDVRAFRAGLAADGLTPLSKTVSFRWDGETEAAVAAVIGTMYVFVDCPSDGFLADPSLRTPIVFKLVAYLSRTGRVTKHAIRDTIQEAAMAASVLAEQPHLIEEPVTFASLLPRFRQAVAESKRVPKPLKPGRPPKPSNTPPRPVVWTSPDGDYVLHELTHPWHLIEETEVLGHCLGRPYDNRWTGQANDLFILPYWQRIARKLSRVFSLAASSGPVCTLHVHVEPPRLVEVQGRLEDSVLMPPYARALVEAVAALRELLPGLITDRLLTLRALERLSRSVPLRRETSACPPHGCVARA